MGKKAGAPAAPNMAGQSAASGTDTFDYSANRGPRPVYNRFGQVARMDPAYGSPEQVAAQEKYDSEAPQRQARMEEAARNKAARVQAAPPGNFGVAQSAPPPTAQSTAPAPEPGAAPAPAPAPPAGPVPTATPSAPIRFGNQAMRPSRGAPLSAKNVQPAAQYLRGGNASRGGNAYGDMR